VLPDDLGMSEAVWSGDFYVVLVVELVAGSGAVLVVGSAAGFGNAMYVALVGAGAGDE
jgi:hypothetical protein